MRIIIYTGKGGVGKTSVAAATALKSARLGHRTLVMSTDAAHSLSDSLDIKLSSEIVNIDENLDAIEVDVLFELENRWKEIEKYITDFLVAQGLDDISAKEMAIWPGMELMSALFYIWDFYRSDEYDVIVLDTAPTAETLRLLSFPDVSDWYFDKVYKVFQRMVRLARVTVGRFMDTPLPTKEFMKDLEHLKERMKVVRHVLTSPEITSVRLVVNPEKMVINETKRAYTYLCLYNLTVESLVVNRLLPEDTEGYFKEKLKEQEHYMEVINESFNPLKIFTSELFQTELVGIPMLERLSERLFGEEDPTQVYSTDKPMDIYDDGENAILSLKLPFSMKKEVELYRSEDALLIQVGSYKRSVSLPYTLVKREILKAEFDEGRLLIKFAKEVEDD
ncbi:MAG: TRC40/GET3/ArsA family transport-energizing ATPase [Methanomassiliicoccales archaeon]|nr:TRC40/GET3/ArsA family transport-energizing ATPase [Methanomassiliicoccales archaeon]NYT14755.1 TRC40/GET3/ArsA family transport-energizing ATPase [Methanomassiliicoccales archaeon]